MVYRSLDPRSMESWAPDVVATYGRAFADAPYRRNSSQVAAFAAAVRRHAIRPGFAGLVAVNGGVVAGFTYGYSAHHNHEWHLHVRMALGELADRWLHDAFVYAELAVEPRYRRRGVGRHLHNLLLTRQRHPRAILSTLDQDTAGRRLYEEAGWQRLVGGVRFPATTAQYVIMGRESVGIGDRAPRPPA